MTEVAQAEKRESDEFDSEMKQNVVTLPKFSRAPITEAGRVAFLGESSNYGLLVHGRQGSSDAVLYPVPDDVRLSELDSEDIDMLHRRGAFLLPPRSLCDQLIDAYFEWVHPIMPVIDRSCFMSHYKDPKKPLSLLLLQSVLLAGCRVCNSAELMDANHSTERAARTFYKRAKALYEANYEDDRVTIVQSLLLMAWYWEGPEDMQNVFYWSHLAITVAQGCGMHRSVELSELNKSDKRLWKRIWWTLFTRDRSVAVALGHPVQINLDDSDVEMLHEDDFIDDADQPCTYPGNPIHVQFFLEYVKLCGIMGMILSQHYSTAARVSAQNPDDLIQSDIALATWLRNCPKAVYWDIAHHNFWAALLHSNYYTALCLLHRAHMAPIGLNDVAGGSSCPSTDTAFQAAAAITTITESLAAHKELRHCPVFTVYSVLTALIMHAYQMKSLVPSARQVIYGHLRTCMHAAKELSRVWPVGRMVYALFESNIGKKMLDRKMQQSVPQLEQDSTRQEVPKGHLSDTGQHYRDSHEQSQVGSSCDPAVSETVTQPYPRLATGDPASLYVSVLENLERDQLCASSFRLPVPLNPFVPDDGQSQHQPGFKSYRSEGGTPQRFGWLAGIWDGDFDDNVHDGQSPESLGINTTTERLAATLLNAEDQ